MRIAFYILCIIIIPFIPKAQNLVPNHSFEEIDSCPNNPTHLNLLKHWFSLGTGTPDVYSSCQSFYPLYDLQSKEGNNHIGLSAFYFVDSTSGLYNYRKYYF